MTQKEENVMGQTLEWSKNLAWLKIIQNLGLGTLEAEVMEVIWRQGEGSAKSVHQILSRRRRIAYTTVLTVLRNLNEKGLLQRYKTNRGSHIYTPKTSKGEFIQTRVGQILDLLLERFPIHTLARIKTEDPERIYKLDSQPVPDKG